MFEIDNTTIALLSALLVLIVYLRLFSKPEPLVHPLLLGKQSEVSNIRKEGETGVYRSWATGQGTPVCSFNAIHSVELIFSSVLGLLVRSRLSRMLFRGRGWGLGLISDVSWILL